MSSTIRAVETAHTPESLVERLQGEAGVILLRSRMFESAQARYSLVAAQPFLTFRSFGSRCEITEHAPRPVQQTTFGNPWHILDALLARFELLDETDQPLPLGGCFGFWGYDLKKFVEPKLRVRSLNDLELPDCHLGFYHSLVAFDHQLGKTFIIATGLGADGSRDAGRQAEQIEFWKAHLMAEPTECGMRNAECGMRSAE